MPSSRVLLSLVILLALAVGYLAGTAGPRTAVAGPTPVRDSNFQYLTSNEFGNELYVWRLQDGLPVAASQYRFSTHSTPEADGTGAIRVLHVAVPAPAKPK
jgi:hypothetical protein